MLARMPTLFVVTLSLFACSDRTAPLDEPKHVHAGLLSITGRAGSRDGLSIRWTSRPPWTPEEAAAFRKEMAEEDELAYLLRERKPRGRTASLDEARRKLPCPTWDMTTRLIEPEQFAPVAYGHMATALRRSRDDGTRR